METKICNKCGVEKSIDRFEYMRDKDRYRTICKDCRNAQHRERYYKRREEILKIKRERYRDNPKYKEYRVKGDKNRKDKRREYNKNRKVSDYLYAFELRIRKKIKKSLSRKGYSKNTKSFEILQCSYSDLKTHLLKSYKEIYHEDWDGVQPVHIDHIIPLSKAKNETEILKLCNYKNLQLLKAEDNMKKGNRLDWNLKK